MEHVEPLSQDPDFERPVDPRRARSRVRSYGWPIVMVIAVVLAAFLVWRGMHPPEPTPPPAAPAATTPAPEPAPAASAPKYPIEAVGPVTEPTSLPPVQDSDSMLQDALAALFAGAPLDRIFYLEQVVPRIVATIDNLPRQTVAQSRMPVRPIGGSLETSQADGRTLLRADNGQRYAQYLKVMESVDTQKLVQTYVRLYPLFQKAYEDLGYPKAYFNDRLVEVIDHLLAAPDVPAPIALSQPKVLYEFADPSLEERSAGQKIMMRMGTVNEARAKAKLRDIRRALTGQKLPR